MSREPRNCGEITYSGIVDGTVKGSWLLSYWLPERDVDVQVAVFDTHEAALDMAAQLDEVSGEDHIWCVETVFLNPSDAAALAAMLWGGGKEDFEDTLEDLEDDDQEDDGQETVFDDEGFYFEP
jgi:hypothetical protein